ncbi:MAG: restriction endonuclease subunit S [Clostridiales bacterium]|nr:restriction endonuclease subunit S [Clostridiales bacterium]
MNDILTKKQYKCSVNTEAVTKGLNPDVEMKDSGTEWIGQIPNDWGLNRIKYVFNLVNGYTFQSSLYAYEGIRVIRISDVEDDFLSDKDVRFYPESFRSQIGEAILKEGDILITLTGYLGKCYLVSDSDVNMGLNQRVGAMRAKRQDVCLKYARRLMQCEPFRAEMELSSNGSAQLNMSTEWLKNNTIPFPPLSKQRRIADFLDAKCAEIDALTADIEKQIETLEQYKRSVITEAVTKGLNPDAEMKDSGVQWIGMMPSNWNCIRGKYILRLLSKPVKVDDGVITCFRDGEVTLRSNRREEGFTMADKEIGYQGIDVGDLVVHGMDGFAGAIGISDSRGKASPVLNVLDSEQNKRYLMYYLRSMAYSDVFTALASGIRVRSCDLRWNKLAELLYPVPSLTEQSKIVEYIDRKLEETNYIIVDKKKHLDALADYKKSLIYEYVTGKKEVPES